MTRAVLDSQQHRAGPLTAEGESLDHTQHQKQDRCQHADLRGGGQHTHQRGRRAHQQHGQGERLLAADPVADVTEDESADGADQEPDRERGECQHRADERALVREEGVVEHQARGRGVQEEVVPLDCRPEHAGQHGGAHRVGSGGCSRLFVYERVSFDSHPR